MAKSFQIADAPSTVKPPPAGVTASDTVVILQIVILSLAPEIENTTTRVKNQVLCRGVIRVDQKALRCQDRIVLEHHSEA